MRSLFALALLGALSACGDNNARFQIAPAGEATEVRLRVQSVEVRDVSLPAFAVATEIVVEDADGGLRPLKRAIWADDPVRGVTLALVRSLDIRTTAAIASEPWPLSDSPDVRLDVRVDQMVARANGSFVLTGQFALASPNGRIAERLHRFSIDVPLPDTTPASVANAAGTSIGLLADEIVARLRR